MNNLWKCNCNKILPTNLMMCPKCLTSFTSFTSISTQFASPSDVVSSGARFSWIRINGGYALLYAGYVFSVKSGCLMGTLANISEYAVLPFEEYTGSAGNVALTGIFPPEEVGLVDHMAGTREKIQAVAGFLNKVYVYRELREQLNFDLVVSPGKTAGSYRIQVFEKLVTGADYVRTSRTFKGVKGYDFPDIIHMRFYLEECRMKYDNLNLKILDLGFSEMLDRVEGSGSYYDNLLDFKVQDTVDYFRREIGSL